ncbi:MAG: hypothetical protein ACI8Y4_001760 [Candidatus Poriferisodalaceae bacterium]|jgi:uncharacterized protein (DUF1330 family)
MERRNMSAFLMAQVDVTDMEQYAKYMARTPRVVDLYGGRFVARGSSPLTLEGDANELRNVIIEFPTREDAIAFYNSPEYGECRDIRAGAATGQFFVLDGYPADEWATALAASQALAE